jgi:hypothetical protein
MHQLADIPSIIIYTSTGEGILLHWYSTEIEAPSSLLLRKIADVGDASTGTPSLSASSLDIISRGDRGDDCFDDLLLGLDFFCFFPAALSFSDCLYNFDIALNRLFPKRTR